jgi:hypothetical protein
MAIFEQIRFERLRAGADRETVHGVFVQQGSAIFVRGGGDVAVGDHLATDRRIWIVVERKPVYSGSEHIGWMLRLTAVSKEP